MNKTTVVSFRLKKIASVFKEGYSLIIMVVVYIAGIISGAFFTHGSDTLFSKAENIYNRFIAHRSEKSFLAIFGYSILEWIPYMLGLFVFPAKQAHCCNNKNFFIFPEFRIIRNKIAKYFRCCAILNRIRKDKKIVILNFICDVFVFY